ncbi:MAG: arginine--tRNA ligase [Flavobacteriales bacterium]
MSLSDVLCKAVIHFLRTQTQDELPKLEFKPTQKAFAGDITLVLFPLCKRLQANPLALGGEIGGFLKERVAEVVDYNVVGGFLNLCISDDYYLDWLHAVKGVKDFGRTAIGESAGVTLVEYSSPNTNKPLHLGHIRNNLLGYSVAEILKAAGHRVIKTQVINDRGIHICKPILAWQKWGRGETPAQAGVKGDHWVGAYYVRFDAAYRVQVADLIARGYGESEARSQAPLLREAREMLRKWEAGDAETRALWREVNSSVYQGFSETYTRLGVDFDESQYESDTYLLGKDLVAQGLEKGVFYKKSDGSVCCDLTDAGLDEKVVLRSDGTSVYITQDLGTAVERFKNHDLDRVIYTVGDEQDYHFKVLFLILKKLGYPWAAKLRHLSYGMVDLPSGRMKSRVGNVVDADELMDEMHRTAREKGVALGKLQGCSDAERERLYEAIGMGALKYHLLKVDPRKRILFNPEESIDFVGHTGPFLQYTHARIQSLLRRTGKLKWQGERVTLAPQERDILKHLERFPQAIQLAAEQLNPAWIAHYSYDLVKSFNHFYQSTRILNVGNATLRAFRLQLAAQTAVVLASALRLLGIVAPERM